MKTLGSLFSGTGGIELGIIPFGYQTIWHCEIDKHASAILADQFPGIPNYGDITKVDWTKVESPDLLTGGFPCQAISLAGKRKVKNDSRWLWPEFERAVRVLRPKQVLIENVAGLLRPWRDPDGWWNPAPIEEVLGDLSRLGYDAQWTCIRASDIGAPHKRKRVFILASHSSR